MLSNTAVVSIMNTFDFCDLPKHISLGMFPIPETPSARWSLINRVIMSASGTYDARGAGQWKSVQRFIIKKAKPIYIVCPQTKQGVDVGGNIVTVNQGFISVPVYGYEWTFGDPIKYHPFSAPVIHLEHLCQKYDLDYRMRFENVEVNTLVQQSAFEMADDDTKVFVWHLVQRVYNDIYPDHHNTAERPLVLEICAQAILHWFSKRILFNGRYYEQIQRYGEKRRLSTIAACFRICKLVEGVLNHVLSVGLRKESKEFVNS